jgi:hypothetical protein
MGSERTSRLGASRSEADPERTFGGHTPLLSGKVLELPVCSHAGPGTGLF